MEDAGILPAYEALPKLALRPVSGKRLDAGEPMPWDDQALP
jgi:hypothetical protein